MDLKQKLCAKAIYVQKIHFFHKTYLFDGNGNS